MKAKMFHCISVSTIFTQWTFNYFPYSKKTPCWDISVDYLKLELLQLGGRCTVYIYTGAKMHASIRTEECSLAPPIYAVQQAEPTPTRPHINGDSVAPTMPPLSLLTTLSLSHLTHLMATEGAYP